MSAAALAAKLALEAELVVPLRRLIVGYDRAWRARNGQFQPFERMVWLGRFDTLLRRHYGRTVQAFRGQTPTGRPDLDAVAVSPEHAERLRDMARTNSERILAGIDRDLMREKMVGNRAVVIAGGTYLKAGNTSGIESKAAKPRFSVSYQGTATARAAARAAAIANVNTQTIAEDTRFTVVDNDKAAGVVTKIWQSLLDGRERPAHHAAHDQKVAVDGRFVVGGEELRFPGDTKFGASLGNVINCRCSAVYFLERPDGSVDRIDQTVAVPARRQKRPGERPGVSGPVNTTTAVTLNGRTRATVALSDGSLAQLTQEGDRLFIRANRKVVASATIVRRGAAEVSIDGLQIAGQFADRGAVTLLHNSVEVSLAREGRRLVPPRLMTDDVFAFWKRRDAASVANDIRMAADAISKWARVQHGVSTVVRFDADGQTARLTLTGGRQLILSRADLETLGLVKTPSN